MGRMIKSEKATQTACLRGFSRYLAGAEGFEPSARGFGGDYPYCLYSTYLRRFPLCCLEKYDGFTTVSFRTIFMNSISTSTLI